MADLIMHDLERREILVVGIADFFGSGDERTDQWRIVGHFLQAIINRYFPEQFVLFKVSAEIGEITQKEGSGTDSRSLCDNPLTLIFGEAEN